MNVSETKRINNLSPLSCAVGIIINPEKKILIAKRAAHQRGGGLWEFPGGKIELEESPEQALIRELQEELGITVLCFEYLMKLNFNYPEYSVALEVFIVNNFLGKPQGQEGQPLLWVDILELDNYPFLEGNFLIIQALKDKYSVT